MPAFTISDLPEEAHQALKLRASRNGTSTQVEIRRILEEALRVQGDVRIGSELAALGRQFGGVELDITRDPAQAKPASFE